MPDEITRARAIVDPFPVSELGERYRSKDGTLLKKSAINDRMNALGIKSFPQPGQGAKRFIRASDVLRLNTLDVYIHENGSMTGFPGLITASTGNSLASTGSSDVSTGNSSIASGDKLNVLEDDLEMFDEVFDKEELGKAPQSRPPTRNTPAIASGALTLWYAITQLSAQEALGRLAKPLQSVFYPNHRKTEDAIRTFSLAVKEEAVLTTSQIADLLNVGVGVFSSKKSVTRMGFTFIRSGKEGRESGWRVVKAKLPGIEQESSPTED